MIHQTKKCFHAYGTMYGRKETSPWRTRYGQAAFEHSECASIGNSKRTSFSVEEDERGIDGGMERGRDGEGRGAGEKTREIAVSLRGNRRAP